MNQDQRLGQARRAIVAGDIVYESDLGIIPKDEVPPYRMITTFNAQITKWGFCALGFVIGFLFCLLIK